MQGRIKQLKALLTEQFMDNMISKDEVKHKVKSAAKVQKIDTGVEAHKKIFEITAQRWKTIVLEGTKRKLFTPKELDILQVAVQMPGKIPSDKPSVILLELYQKAEIEGI